MELNDEWCLSGEFNNILMDGFEEMIEVDKILLSSFPYKRYKTNEESKKNKINSCDDNGDNVRRLFELGLYETINLMCDDRRIVYFNASVTDILSFFSWCEKNDIMFGRNDLIISFLNGIMMDKRYSWLLCEEKEKEKEKEGEKEEYKVVVRYLVNSLHKNVINIYGMKKQEEKDVKDNRVFCYESELEEYFGDF